MILVDEPGSDRVGGEDRTSHRNIERRLRAGDLVSDFDSWLSLIMFSIRSSPFRFSFQRSMSSRFSTNTGIRTLGGIA